MEFAIARVGESPETNVINVLRVIMIFHIVILVDVLMKEVLILFATQSLVTVIAKKMCLAEDVMNVPMTIMDFPTAQVMLIGHSRN